VREGADERMKDEGGRMKFVLNRINFILHPSYFILPKYALTVGLPPRAN
jgi:hypothetical protein